MRSVGCSEELGFSSLDAVSGRFFTSSSLVRCPPRSKQLKGIGAANHFTGQLQTLQDDPFFIITQIRDPPFGIGKEFLDSFSFSPCTYDTRQLLLAILDRFEPPTLSLFPGLRALRLFPPLSLYFGLALFSFSVDNLETMRIFYQTYTNICSTQSSEKSETLSRKFTVNDIAGKFGWRTCIR
jgi:hypothetical protein